MKRMILILSFLWLAGCSAGASEKTVLSGLEHSHVLASDPELIDNPIDGFCGNTLTTLYLSDEEYTLWGSDSTDITAILINLRYDEEVCRCPIEFSADTEFETGYGINLTRGFVRLGNGQSSLTDAQIQTIEAVLSRIENKEADILK